MESAHLIVGLGNPGAKYEGTRHNVGFLVVRKMADKWVGGWKEEKKFKALMSQVTMDDQRIHLCQPQTYMNRSGESVGLLCDYYRIPARKVLVVVDDVELAFGQLRMRPDGGSGGHNGLGSVEQHLATSEYLRLRVGVGKPAHEAGLTSHVLGRFTPDESSRMTRCAEVAVQQCECWLRHGSQRAMSEFNGNTDFPGEQTERENT
ncbi:MAG: aminoacyl-tRNA hydrolase [Candidatus Marinimicrobia bacterium]|nr:aminoacyl-tRNA hydrolase [Candidatus Neomarinimicrobiota bacterium]|tara:strand:+ start:787 stop:1401 length:615 start_codon:yes stop_codon:yes gene_type:complete